MNDRATVAGRLAVPAFLLLLAAALAIGSMGGLRLESPPAGPADEVAAVLDALPDDPTVLVAFDPDLGTYAEVRPTVRAMLADLLDRGARIALVSLTAEGRALGLAEAARMRREGLADDALADLGFVPGAEAGVVALARAMAGESSGGLGPWPVDELGGPPAMALVVGGNDIGPRTWVEQLSPRVDGVAMIAVTPTVLLPEVRPYRASGQLDALLGTPRDGAAYRLTVDLRGSGGSLVEDDYPTGLAVLAGLLAALAWVGAALMARLAAAVRGGGDAEPA